MPLAHELRHRVAALGNTVVATGEEEQGIGLIVVDLCGHRLGMLAIDQADFGGLTAFSPVGEDGRPDIVLPPPQPDAALADDVTADYCTLPVPVDDLLHAIDIRRQRERGTWASLGIEEGPDRAVLKSTRVALPAQVTTPEAYALLACVDGRLDVDSLAFELGFTRAEAVHLCGMLVRYAAVEHDPESLAPDAPAETLLVPESFGRPLTPRTVVPPSCVRAAMSWSMTARTCESSSSTRGLVLFGNDCRDKNGGVSMI